MPISPAMSDNLPSLRSSERGLKYSRNNRLTIAQHVAPFVGAWIEILGFAPLCLSRPSLRSSERGLKLLNLNTT